MLDSTKAAKKSQVQGRGMNPDDETALSEEARAEIEAKEDDFVSQVEEAQGVMKNVSSMCTLWYG
jgi:antirestriction protein